jgi:hypothetical protein
MVTSVNHESGRPAPQRPASAAKSRKSGHFEAESRDILEGKRQEGKRQEGKRQEGERQEGRSQDTSGP